VIWYDVEDESHAAGVEFGYQALELVLVAESGSEHAGVDDIVPVLAPLAGAE
jgi:hypothetical protein